MYQQLQVVIFSVFLTSVTWAISESDFNPPEIAVVVDSCTQNDQMLPLISQLKNKKIERLDNISSDPKNYCWTFNTFYYEIFETEDCSVEAMLDQLEMTFNSNMDTDILILTDSCEKLKEMEPDIENSVRNSNRINVIMPFNCTQNEIFQIIVVDKNSKLDKFIMSELEVIPPEDKIQQILFIYDESNNLDQTNENSMEINPVKILQHFSSAGFRIKMSEIQSPDDVTAISDIISQVQEETQVYIASEFNKTSALLKRAMEKDLFHNRLISWIIFTNDDLKKFESISLKIQYNTKMLLIRRKKPEVSYEMQFLLPVTLEYANSATSDVYSCSLCEHQSTSTQIFRMAYKAGEKSGITLLCSAVIDIWSRFRLTEADGTVWTPEHLMMTGVHFTITVVPDKPFVVQIDPPQNYSGFMIDILDIIRRMYNFTYTLIEPEDKTYGTLYGGRWNGMMGQLHDKKADIAWAALAIEANRAKFVDFSSTHILFSGGKIIYKKKLSDENKFVSPWKTVYTQPFKPEVWLFIIATIVFSCISLSFLEMNQLKHLNKRKDSGHMKESQISYENFFLNPFDNLMYMYSALVQQGWDKTPDRTPSRVLVIFYRVFCLIMYAGYSAVIISQYIISAQTKPFESIADIVADGTYKLGTVNGTTYISDLKNHHGAWELVQKDKENLVGSQQQMLNRILEHNYASIYDEYSVDHITSTNCSFQSVEDVMMKRLCTIAFQKGSPYVEVFSYVLSKLQENGIIKRIYMKWFQSQYCAQKAVDAKKTDQDSITLQHTTIPFSTILAGIATGFVILIAELTHVKYANPKMKLKNGQKDKLFMLLN